MISPLPGREKTISVDYSSQGGLEICQRVDVGKFRSGN